MKYKQNNNMKVKGKKKFSLNKNGRIIIRNIPFQANEEKLRQYFASFGKIREVNLLRRHDGNLVGCAFIQFNSEDIAAQAVKNCSGKKFMGRIITVEMALEKGRYIVSRPDVEPEVDHHIEEECSEEMEIGIGDRLSDDKPDNSDDDASNDSNKNPEPIKKYKEPRQKETNVKKGRIIVRNVSFKATEDDLKKHFSSFGELSEVTLLRRPDGRMVGCGFIQFTDRNIAAKAIVEYSGKPFRGRPIILDWAVPKRVYTKNNPEQDIEMKEEPVDGIKVEEDEDETESVKSEPNSDVKSECDADSEDNESADDMEEQMDTDKYIKEPVAKQKFSSNDVSEGRTVFVKNIPFPANNKDLKETMKQFGEVEYALICYDQLTEHSKGTGFVKFQTVESTQACLSAGTELTLHGQVLDCHEALSRDVIQAKAKNGTEKKVAKDNRNLYLIREGVVLAGSKAAVNVSVTDMAKRLQLEQLKTQMLRNLNMFVSKNRIVVQNLPPSYDDKKLYQLFVKHSKPNTVITEAKVMRDMRNVDENGIGKSKEMGFVRFAIHEDALNALRKINNNPDIFTITKRPIVAFAIENRMIHKIKERRVQKSRDKNPTFNNKQDDKPAIPSSKMIANNKRKKLLKFKKKIKSTPVVTEESGNVKLVAKNSTSKKLKSVKQVQSADVETEEYTGTVAQPGNTKLRTKYNLKAQASLHTETVRKDMKKKKSNKKLKQQQQIQREHIKQPKQKQGSQKKNIPTKDDVSFNTLVNKYKSQIVPPLMKKKWYQLDK